eukprot:6172046-Pleurochrysis_carterae.AAC.5
MHSLCRAHGVATEHVVVSELAQHPQGALCIIEAVATHRATSLTACFWHSEESTCVSRRADQCIWMDWYTGWWIGVSVDRWIDA